MILSEFLNIYIFHWVPEKALYIGGHSFLWDARCAGIYIGFGIGLLYLLIAGRKDKDLPPRHILLINTLMFLPMFIDLISIWVGFRAPSNAMRYLTGILFGGALSIYLYPAFISLVFSGGRNHSAINSIIKYGIFLFAGITAFFVKRIDSMVVFIVLSSLSLVGFISFIVMVLIGSISGVGKLSKVRGLL